MAASFERRGRDGKRVLMRTEGANHSERLARDSKPVVFDVNGTRYRLRELKRAMQLHFFAEELATPAGGLARAPGCDRVSACLRSAVSGTAGWDGILRIADRACERVSEIVAGICSGLRRPLDDRGIPEIFVAISPRGSLGSFAGDDRWRLALGNFFGLSSSHEIAGAGNQKLFRSGDFRAGPRSAAIQARSAWVAVDPRTNGD